MTEIAIRMAEFIETHDLVRNHIKILKKLSEDSRERDYKGTREPKCQRSKCKRNQEDIQIPRAYRFIILEAFYRPCTTF